MRFLLAAFILVFTLPLASATLYNYSVIVEADAFSGDTYFNSSITSLGNGHWRVSANSTVENTARLTVLNTIFNNGAEDSGETTFTNPVRFITDNSDDYNKYVTQLYAYQHHWTAAGDPQGSSCANMYLIYGGNSSGQIDVYSRSWTNRYTTGGSITLYLDILSDMSTSLYQTSHSGSYGEQHSYNLTHAYTNASDASADNITLRNYATGSCSSGSNPYSRSYTYAMLLSDAHVSLSLVNHTYLDDNYSAEYQLVFDPFIYPTPASGTVVNSQQSLYANCTSGGTIDIYMYNTTWGPTNVISSASSHVVYNTSVTSNTEYYYFAQCSNEPINSTPRYFEYDVVRPVATLNSNNFFQSYLLYYIPSQLSALNHSINYTDNENIFGYEFFIFDSSGTLVFNDTNTTINGSSVNISTTYDLSAYNDDSTYTVNVSVWDTHTTKEIPDYEIEKVKENKVKIDKKITLESVEGNDFLLTKLKDRYIFDVTYDSAKNVKKDTFIIETDGDLYYLEDSPYFGHIIDFKNKRWIDFVSPDVESVTIKEKNKGRIVIDVSYYDKTESVTFHSLGGLNSQSYLYYYQVVNPVLSWIDPSSLSKTYSGNSFDVDLSIYSGYPDNTTFYLYYANGTLLNTTNKKVYFSGNVTQTIEYDILDNESNYIVNATHYDSLGGITYSSSVYLYSINNVDVGLCNASLLYPILNITYLDFTTDAAINVTNDFGLIFDDGSNEFNVTGNTQTYYVTVCMNFNASSLPYNFTMTGTMQMQNDDYPPKLWVFDPVVGLSVSNNPMTELPVYLINLTESNTMTYTWINSNYEFVDGTQYIYKCNGDGTKSLMDVFPVVNGEGSANINLYYTLYAYKIIIDGVEYAQDNFYTCHTESSTERTFYVTTVSGDVDTILAVYGASCSLEKVTSNEVNLTWSASTSLDACINAYRVTATGPVQIYHNCTTGQSGTESRSIPSSGYNYLVEAYLNKSNVIAYCGDTVDFTELSTANNLAGTTGIYGSVIMLGAMFLLFSGNGILMMAGLVVGILVMVMLSFLAVPLPVIIAIVCFLGFIGWIGWKRRGT